MERQKNPWFQTTNQSIIDILILVHNVYTKVYIFHQLDIPMAKWQYDKMGINRVIFLGVRRSSP